MWSRGVTRNAPPPEACQLTARYLADAEIKFESQALAVTGRNSEIRAGQSEKKEGRTTDLYVLEAVFGLASGSEGVSVGRLPDDETGHGGRESWGGWKGKGRRVEGEVGERLGSRRMFCCEESARSVPLAVVRFGGAHRDSGRTYRRLQREVSSGGDSWR